MDSSWQAVQACGKLFVQFSEAIFKLTAFLKIMVLGYKYMRGGEGIYADKHAF